MNQRIVIRMMDILKSSKHSRLSNGLIRTQQRKKKSFDARDFSKLSQLDKGRKIPILSLEFSTEIL
jgi:hypothetical protein